jgi:hypothetical protein
MVGSVLTVTIVEARELKSSRIRGNMKPYVAITVDN